MVKSLFLVLIADKDNYSNAAISRYLRKLGLARNVVCTSSTANALAYLEKQQVCNYPFPEMIFFNPHRSDINPAEFLEIYRTKFWKYYRSKLVLLEDRNSMPSVDVDSNEGLIWGKLRKPLSSNKLRTLFQKELREPAH